MVALITPLPPAPQRTDPANFATRADALVAALPNMVNQINAVALATTGTGNFTNIAASGTATLGVPLGQSSGGTGWPLGSPIRMASGNLVGNVANFFFPANVQAVRLQFWNFASTTDDAELLLQVGNGTVGSPNWLNANYITHNLFSFNGGTPSYATSTTTAWPLSGPQRSASPDACGTYDILGFGVAGTPSMFGQRLSISSASAITIASDHHRATFSLSGTSIRLFPAAGTMQGKYIITGYVA